MKKNRETYTPANSINKQTFEKKFDVHRYENQRILELYTQLKLKIIELKQQIKELKNE